MDHYPRARMGLGTEASLALVLSPAGPGASRGGRRWAAVSFWGFIAGGRDIAGPFLSLSAPFFPFRGGSPPSAETAPSSSGVRVHQGSAQPGAVDEPRPREPPS